MSIGFAHSSSSLLWALSFLFGFLFHSHGRRPMDRGSLCRIHSRRLSQSLVERGKKQDMGGLSHLEHCSLERVSCLVHSNPLSPTDQERCAHRSPQLNTAGRSDPTSGWRQYLELTGPSCGSKSTLPLSCHCCVPSLSGPVSFDCPNPAFGPWSVLANCLNPV